MPVTELTQATELRAGETVKINLTTRINYIQKRHNQLRKKRKTIKELDFFWREQASSTAVAALGPNEINKKQQRTKKQLIIGETSCDQQAKLARVVQQ